MPPSINGRPFGKEEPWPGPLARGRGGDGTSKENKQRCIPTRMCCKWCILSLAVTVCRHFFFAALRNFFLLSACGMFSGHTT